MEKRTTRDELAEKYVEMIFVRPQNGPMAPTWEVACARAAKKAYILADAMIRERNK